jgi:hypothetical protein
MRENLSDGKVRNPITEEFYPDKVTAEEFTHIITNELRTANFILNMQALDNFRGKKLYPEDWMSIFTRWSELNK